MVKKKVEIFTRDKEYKFRGKDQPTRRVEKEIPGESGKLSAR